MSEKEQIDDPIQKTDSEEIIINPERFRLRWSNLTLKQKRIIGGVMVGVLLIAGLIQLGFFAGVWRFFNSASVTIYVKDSQSKTAVSGAKVNFTGENFLTDSQGYIKISNLVAGKISLVVEADKYVSKTVELRLHRGDNGTLEVLLLRAPPNTATIEGTVLGLVDQKGLEAVIVALVDSPVPISTKSATGKFKLLIPAGKQTLSFTLPGYTTKKQVVDAVDKKTTTMDVVLTPLGRAVFVSNRDGDSVLYSINFDGSDLKKLVPNVKGKDDKSANISPDGKKILFTSTREGKVDSYGNQSERLYVVDSDGTNLKKVSDDEVYNQTWFPDSSQIVYSVQNQIKSLAVSSSSLKTLVTVPAASSSATFVNFAVAPNSKLLGYSNETGVYTANRDGSNQTKIGSEPYVYSVSFSTDSNKLDYEYYLAGALKHFQVDLISGLKSEIPLSSVRGRFVQRAGGGFYDFNPEISPSGKRIAYVSFRDGKNDIYLANTDLTGETRLTSSGGVVNTVFTSSGDYLVYRFAKEQESSLYIVAVDGGKPLKITDASELAGVVQ